MTVGQMLDAMEMEEYLDWMAFDRIEPMGNAAINQAVAHPVSWLVSLQARKDIKAQSLMPYPDRKYFEVQPSMKWVGQLKNLLGMK